MTELTGLKWMLPQVNYNRTLQVLDFTMRLQSRYLQYTVNLAPNQGHPIVSL